MSSTVLEVRNLKWSKPDGEAIFSNVHFDVHEGEVIIIQGKSGSGKSTLLKCLAHLNIYEGEILYRGKTPKSYGVPRYRTHVLYVPQRASLLPGTPRDFLETMSTFASYHEKTKKGMAKGPLTAEPHKAIQIGESWGLEETLWDRTWSNLSGGETQRMALAIAVGMDTAEILLLDEPTSALDADTSSHVEKYLLSKVKGGRGSLKAILWITHSPEQGQRVGTRFMRVSSGGMREEDIDPGV